MSKRRHDTKWLIQLRAEAIELVNKSNAKFRPERQVAHQTALKVVDRSLAYTYHSSSEVRKFAALRALSSFISLATIAKTSVSSLEHADLLTVGHPFSTAPHAMSVNAFRSARAQWIASDPLVDDSMRSLVASAHSLAPGSIERQHAFARLAAAGPKLVPITAAIDMGDVEIISTYAPSALTAGLLSFVGGNSRAARSMRAKLQRRDRYGRFAFMGGGFSFKMKMGDGSFRSFSGRVVGRGTEADADSGLVEVELLRGSNGLKVAGQIVKVPSNKGTAVKAIIPQEGLEGLPDQGEVQADDVFVSAGEMIQSKTGAPDGWKPVKMAKDSNGKEYATQWESPDGYVVNGVGQYSHNEDYENVGPGSAGWATRRQPQLQPARQELDFVDFPVVDTWADVEDVISRDQNDYEADLKKYNSLDGDDAAQKAWVAAQEAKGRKNAADKPQILREESDSFAEQLQDAVGDDKGIRFNVNGEGVSLKPTEVTDTSVKGTDENGEEREIKLADIQSMSEEAAPAGGTGGPGEPPTGGPSAPRNKLQEVYNLVEEAKSIADGMVNAGEFDAANAIEADGLLTRADELFTEFVDEVANYNGNGSGTFKELVDSFNDAVRGESADNIPDFDDALSDILRDLESFDEGGFGSGEPPTGGPGEPPTGGPSAPTGGPGGPPDIFTMFDNMAERDPEKHSLYNTERFYGNEPDEVINARMALDILYTVPFGKGYVDPETGIDLNLKEISDLSKKYDKIITDWIKAGKPKKEAPAPTDAEKAAKAASFVPLGDPGASGEKNPVADLTESRTIRTRGTVKMSNGEQTAYFDEEDGDGIYDAQKDGFRIVSKTGGASQQRQVPKYRPSTGVTRDLQPFESRQQLENAINAVLSKGDNIRFKYGAKEIVFQPAKIYDNKKNGNRNVTGWSVADGDERTYNIDKIAPAEARKAENVAESAKAPVEQAKTDVVRLDPDSTVVPLRTQIQNAIENKNAISFEYGGKPREVTPVRVWTNPKNGNENVTVREADGTEKNFTLSKIEKPKQAKVATPARLSEDEIADEIKKISDGLGEESEVPSIAYQYLVAENNAAMLPDNTTFKQFLDAFTKGMDPETLEELKARSYDYKWNHIPDGSLIYGVGEGGQLIGKTPSGDWYDWSPLDEDDEDSEEINLPVEEKTYSHEYAYKFEDDYDNWGTNDDDSGMSWPQFRDRLISDDDNEGQGSSWFDFIHWSWKKKKKEKNVSERLPLEERISHFTNNASVYQFLSTYTDYMVSESGEDIKNRAPGFELIPDAARITGYDPQTNSYVGRVGDTMIMYIWPAYSTPKSVTWDSDNWGTNDDGSGMSWPQFRDRLVSGEGDERPGSSWFDSIVWNEEGQEWRPEPQSKSVDTDPLDLLKPEKEEIPETDKTRTIRPIDGLGLAVQRANALPEDASPQEFFDVLSEDVKPILPAEHPHHGREVASLLPADELIYGYTYDSVFDFLKGIPTFLTKSPTGEWSQWKFNGGSGLNPGSMTKSPTGEWVKWEWESGDELDRRPFLPDKDDFIGEDTETGLYLTFDDFRKLMKDPIAYSNLEMDRLARFNWIDTSMSIMNTQSERLPSRDRAREIKEILNDNTRSIDDAIDAYVAGKRTTPINDNLDAVVNLDDASSAQASVIVKTSDGNYGQLVKNEDGQDELKLAKDAPDAWRSFLQEFVNKTEKREKTKDYALEYFINDAVRGTETTTTPAPEPEPASEESGVVDLTTVTPDSLIPVIEDAIANNKDVSFVYHEKPRVVKPFEITVNPKNNRPKLRGLEYATDAEKEFFLDKFAKPVNEGLAQTQLDDIINLPQEELDQVFDALFSAPAVQPATSGEEAVLQEIDTKGSTAVNRAAYDPQTQELFIQFGSKDGKGGGIYKYADVPQDFAYRFAASDSLGKMVPELKKIGKSEKIDEFPLDVVSTPIPGEIDDTKIVEPSDTRPVFSEAMFDEAFPAVAEGFYKVNIFDPYVPVGATEGVQSSDFSDVPTILANKFSTIALLIALKDAISPDEETGAPATGFGQLWFDAGDEYVSAEALYAAVSLVEGEAEVILAGIYDMAVGGTENTDLALERSAARAKKIADGTVDDFSKLIINMDNVSRSQQLDNAKMLNGMLANPQSASRVVRALDRYAEPNDTLVNVANRLMSIQDTDPDRESVNTSTFLEQYLPLSESPSEDDREAFRAVWGMLMSLDGGDSIDFEGLRDDDDHFRARVFQALIRMEGSEDAAQDAYDALVSTYGGYPEFVIGRQRLADGEDDLNSKTTAAAFVRLIAAAARPNVEPLYRYIGVSKDDRTLDVYTTPGSVFDMDPRSFTSFDITNSDPEQQDSRNKGFDRVFFVLDPGQGKTIAAHHVSPFQNEDEHFGYGTFEVVSVDSKFLKLGSIQEKHVVKIRQVTSRAGGVEDFEPTSEAVVPDYGDISMWKEVRPGSQAGSNEGGFFKDTYGNQYYIKKGRSQSHVDNETLATAFYRELGLPAPMQGYGMRDGELWLVSPIVSSERDFSDLLDDKDFMSQVRDGFAIDAWLSNYDVTGYGYDNIIPGANGEPIRIDNGGALRWRATGGDKPWFDADVTELDTMRDPKLARIKASAQVFGEMTEDDVAKSARRLLDISPSRISGMVKSAVKDPDEANEIAEILIARREQILSRYGLDTVNPDDDILGEPTSLATSMGFEARDLQPEDVTAGDSFTVERVFHDANTPKGKVSVEGYFPGHETQRKEWNEGTVIDVFRGAPIPPKGDKPALHRPKRPVEPKAPAFTGAAAELIDGASGWEEVRERLRNTELVFFDYETTGFPDRDKGDFSTNQPVQLGAVRVVNGEVVDRFNVHMNPGEPLGLWSRENLKRDGGVILTDDWLAEQPGKDEVHRQFTEWAGENAIFGAHNAPFDIKVFNGAVADAGIDYSPAGVIDTLKLSQQFMPSKSQKVKPDPNGPLNHKLPTLVEFFGGALEGWHSADADAEAVGNVLDGIIRAINDKPLPDLAKDAQKYERDKENFDRAKKEYAQALLDYETAKAVAAAWNCGGGGGLISAGDQYGDDCNVPSLDEIIARATPDESDFVDPDGIHSGPTDGSSSPLPDRGADDQEDYVIPFPENVDPAELFKGEKFMPTQQQQNIIAAWLTGEDVVVLAKAGTGKTTTLTLGARVVKSLEPSKKLLYIAYNRSVADEAMAKFPPNTIVKTSDAVAYNFVKTQYPDLFKKFKSDSALFNKDDIAKFLGLSSVTIGEDKYEASEIASMVQDTIFKFEISADPVLGSQHVFEADVPKELRDAVLSAAQTYWSDILNSDGSMPFAFNEMKKLWSMSKPDFAGLSSGVDSRIDVVMLDEAQDTNDAVGSVVLNQPSAQVIMVGDPDQAIYQFNGAKDQLQNAVAPYRLPLTESWRYGPEIGGFANRFLSLKEKVYGILTNRGIGRGPAGEVMVPGTMEDAEAVIVRSNAGAFKDILIEIEAGRTVGVTKSFYADLKGFIEATEWLQGGGSSSGKKRPTRMPDDLRGFRSWKEVVNEAQKGDKSDLGAKTKILVDTVEQEGIKGLYDILGKIKQIESVSDAKKSIGDGTGAAPSEFDIPDEVGVGAYGQLTDGISFSVDPVGIAITGKKTFPYKEEIKKAGAKWNADSKVWKIPATTDDGRRAALQKLQNAIRDLEGFGSTPEARAEQGIDVVVSTAHQMKGLEFGRVRVGGDFRGPRVNKDTDEIEWPSISEFNLAYVTATRAINALDPGSLDWIYDATTENDESPFPVAEVAEPEADAEEQDVTPTPEVEEGGDGGAEEPPAVPTALGEDGPSDDEQAVYDALDSVFYAIQDSADTKGVKDFGAKAGINALIDLRKKLAGIFNRNPGLNDLIDEASTAIETKKFSDPEDAIVDAQSKLPAAFGRGVAQEPGTAETSQDDSGSIVTAPDITTPDEPVEEDLGELPELAGASSFNLQFIRDRFAEVDNMFNEASANMTRPSSKTIVNDVREGVNAVLRDLVAGNITLDDAYEQLADVANSVPEIAVNSKNPDADEIAALSDYVMSIRDAIEEVKFGRRLSEHLPPPELLNKAGEPMGTSKNGILIRRGMRIRDRNGFAGRVLEYNKSDWIGVFIRFDLDPRDPASVKKGKWGPGVARYIRTASTLEVIGEDEAPWVDIRTDAQKQKDADKGTDPRPPSYDQQLEIYNNMIQRRNEETWSGEESDRSDDDDGDSPDDGGGGSAPTGPEPTDSGDGGATPEPVQREYTEAEATAAANRVNEDIRDSGNEGYADATSQSFLQKLSAEVKNAEPNDKTVTVKLDYEVDINIDDAKALLAYYLKEPYFPKAEAPEGASEASDELADQLGEEISSPDGEQNSLASRTPDDELLIKLISGGGSTDKDVELNKLWADHLEQYTEGDGPADRWIKEVTDFLASLGNTFIDMGDEDVLKNLIEKKLVTVVEPDEENPEGTYSVSGALNAVLHGMAGFTSGLFSSSKDEKEIEQKLDVMEQSTFYADGGGYLDEPPTEYGGSPREDNVKEFWKNFATILSNPDVLSNPSADDRELLGSNAGALLRALRVAAPLEGTFTRVLHFMEDIEDESHPLHYMLNEGQEVLLRPTSWMKRDSDADLDNLEDDGLFQYGNFGKLEGALGDVLFTVTNARGLNKQPLPNDYGETEIILTGGRYKVVKAEKKEINGHPYTHFTLEDVSREPRQDPDRSPVAIENPVYEFNPEKDAKKYQDNLGEIYDNALGDDVNDANATAMRLYQEDQDTWVAANYRLRGTKTSTELEEEYGVEVADLVTVINAFDEEIDKVPGLPKNTLLYRGTRSRSAETLFSRDVGEEFTDLGFVSTSLEYETAEMFSSTGDGNQNNGVILEIEAPAGTKAISLAAYFGDEVDAETEIVLARGTTFRVLSKTDATDDKPLRTVRVAVIDQTENVTQEPVQVDEEEDDVTYNDIENWTRIGPQTGSNPGGTFRDENGNTYYVKVPRTDLHAQNEALAAALYKELQVPAVEVLLGEENGELRTVSPIVKSIGVLGYSPDRDVVEKLQEGFAVDAWLANWDVAGLTFDNVIIDTNGNPVRVDPGGALMWRAQGEPKGKIFGDVVGEIDTLRDKGMAKEASVIFGDMTDDQVKESAKVLLNISPERIDEIVDSIIADFEEAAAMKVKLRNRRQDILDRFGLTDADKIAEVVDEPLVEEETVPDNSTKTVTTLGADISMPNVLIEGRGAAPDHTPRDKELIAKLIAEGPQAMGSEFVENWAKAYENYDGSDTDAADAAMFIWEMGVDAIINRATTDELVQNAVIGIFASTMSYIREALPPKPGWGTGRPQLKNDLAEWREDFPTDLVEKGRLSEKVFWIDLARYFDTPELIDIEMTPASAFLRILRAWDGSGNPAQEYDRFLSFYNHKDSDDDHPLKYMFTVGQEVVLRPSSWTDAGELERFEEFLAAANSGSPDDWTDFAKDNEDQISPLEVGHVVLRVEVDNAYAIDDISHVESEKESIIPNGRYRVKSVERVNQPVDALDPSRGFIPYTRVTLEVVPLERKKKALPTSALAEAAKELKVNLDVYFDEALDIDDVEQATNKFSLAKTEHMTASDAVIIKPSDGGDLIAMIEREFGPFRGAYALPGGMLDVGETFAQAADREMQEEVGIDAKDAVSRKNLGAVTSSPDWDPRFVNGVSVGAVSYVVPDGTELNAQDDARSALWVPVEDLANGVYPIAFGHAAWLAEHYKDDPILGEKFEIIVEASKERNGRLIEKINKIREELDQPQFTLYGKDAPWWNPVATAEEEEVVAAEASDTPLELDYKEWRGGSITYVDDAGVTIGLDVRYDDLYALKNGSLEPPALPFFVPLYDTGEKDSGEGYYFAKSGKRYWGRYGAAGALLRRVKPTGAVEYLLAKRSANISAGGGQWAWPGGAHKDKAHAQSPQLTAYEELKEEVGIYPAGIEPVATHTNFVEPDWQYETMIVDVTDNSSLTDSLKISDDENSELGWFTAEQILDLKEKDMLHPAVASSIEDVLAISEAYDIPVETPDDTPEAPTAIPGEQQITPTGRPKVVPENPLPISASAIDGTYSLMDAIHHVKNSDDVAVSAFVDGGDIEDLEVRASVVVDESTGEKKLSLRFKLTDWAANKFLDPIRFVRNNNKEDVVNPAKIKALKLSDDLSEAKIKEYPVIPEESYVDPVNGTVVTTGKMAKIAKFGATANDKRPVIYEGSVLVIDDQQGKTGALYAIVDESGDEFYLPDFNIPINDRPFTHEDSAQSYDNTVRIYLPINATEDQVARALKAAGVQDVRSGTKEDLKVIAENRLLSIFAKYTDPAKNLDVQVARDGWLEKIKTDHNVTADDIEFRVSNTGRIEMLFPEEKAKEIHAKLEIDRFEHTMSNIRPALQYYADNPNVLYGGISDVPREYMATAAAKAILKTLSADRLNSTMTRLLEGNQDIGLSSDADIKKGSADYVFTTPVHAMEPMSDFSNEGASNDLTSTLYVFSSEKLLRRLDIFGNRDDNFGQRKENHDIYGEIGLNYSPIAYEAMFKHDIDFGEYLTHISVASDIRNEILGMLNESGISTMYGIPVEELFVVHGDVPNRKKTAEHISSMLDLVEDFDQAQRSMGAMSIDYNDFIATISNMGEYSTSSGATWFLPAPDGSKVLGLTGQSSAAVSSTMNVYVLEPSGGLYMYSGAAAEDVQSYNMQTTYMRRLVAKSKLAYTMAMLENEDSGIEKYFTFIYGTEEDNVFSRVSPFDLPDYVPAGVVNHYLSEDTWRQSLQNLIDLYDGSSILRGIPITTILAAWSLSNIPIEARLALLKVINDLAEGNKPIISAATPPTVTPSYVSSTEYFIETGNIVGGLAGLETTYVSGGKTIKPIYSVKRHALEKKEGKIVIVLAVGTDDGKKIFELKEGTDLMFDKKTGIGTFSTVSAQYRIQPLESLYADSDAEIKKNRQAK